MGERTLTLKKSDFESSVARYKGWSTVEGERSSAENEVLADYVASGLRQFYFPALPGGRVYEWSFLKPVVDLTLGEGGTGLDLPDDFGSLSGPVAVVESGSTGAVSLPVSGVGAVLERRRNDPDATGAPELLAVTPLKGTSLTEGQRYRLEVWPQADADYTLSVPMAVLLDALSGSRPYAYGGQPHSETILESCLSIAEQRGNDQMGVHTQKYAERLAASIAYDQRLKPADLGYNGDGPAFARDRRDGITVTFDGVLYE